MLTHNQTGGPCYPCNDNQDHKGLTIRDRFALELMAAFIVSDSNATDMKNNVPIDFDKMSAVCYAFANAMIDRRRIL